LYCGSIPYYFDPDQLFIFIPLLIRILLHEVIKKLSYTVSYRYITDVDTGVVFS
jgi:hypothetical protein